MTLLNSAGRIYIGAHRADAVFAGNTQVWPSSSAGYAVFDAASAADVALTGSNLVVTNTASGMGNMGAKVLPGKTTGKFYYEATLTDWATGGSVGIGGVGAPTASFNDMQSGSVYGIMLQASGGQIWSNFTVPGSIGTRADGDVVGFAVNLDIKRIWIRLVYPTVGLWNGGAGEDPTNTGTGIALPLGLLAPFCTFGGASTGPGNRVTTNFGSLGFFGAIPVGFIAGWLA